MRGNRQSTLSPEQAQWLLAPVGPIEVIDISVAATTNDVFKVVTVAHGNFYVKFHTARWYADMPDTDFVVERECAVHEFLRQRGPAQPYPAWGDLTRAIVSRSVYLCGELDGIPITEAMARFPAEREAMLRALGAYLRRLHAIRFTAPGMVAAGHAAFGPEIDPIPAVETWDGHSMHHAAHLRRELLELLEQKAGDLSRDLVPRLREWFQAAAEASRANYDSPRLTVGNCHAWHFHVGPADGGWAVLGFYDFEAVSAGDPTTDLSELEVTLTPALQSTAWRAPFFAGYGAWPDLESYKLRLFHQLLCFLGRPRSRQIPDPAWLAGQWRRLLEASDWSELEWFPQPSERAV